MLTIDQLALLLVLTQCLMTVVAAFFLISGLDDLFIDICYAVRDVHRRLFILPKYPPLSEKKLRLKKEQHIAVMVPAWDESAVIRPMLENTLRALDYTNYTIFVGTYPNDPATHVEVDAVSKTHDKVQRIVCPNDGPTCKADCLNWIYQGIKAYEKKHGVRFEIFVMQDCEDVIHPLCYKLFNYLIPRKDMVQLPVESLEAKWYEFTAGHYIDEFAQSHYKDMVVRESLSRSIPAAGVGCAFSRHAIELVAHENNGQLFSIDSLTEDYDFGFRLKKFGLKQIFVRFYVDRVVTKKSLFTGNRRLATKKECVCIREYFPSKYRAAVRQKSRWVVGIVFQGWANLGWTGNLWTRYMLFRDRKALITNLINLVGYAIGIIIGGLWLSNVINPDSYHYPSLLERDTLLWNLLLANAFLLAVRVFQRAYCVYRLYGWLQALLSFPRMVWGNLINFMATCRAIHLYARYLKTGKFIAWDKTSHRFPSEEELLGLRRKLGELLLEAQLVTVEQLNEALARQRRTSHKLGETLRQMGVIVEGDLAQVLQRQ